ncbi:stress enhanced protein 1 chloroplastic [Phtheirospermum japonicum]|uniref:Stress enhanced protein 1 chloroplastic n=1 Tax=Phtheirospermum japonicum TaxID=374723 RepID=A0A830CYF7_9LAMI|nr:stress enhanced protein 1 chloroplastic [Phtheirospermum japonicum]
MKALPLYSCRIFCNLVRVESVCRSNRFSFRTVRGSSSRPVHGSSSSLGCWFLFCLCVVGLKDLEPTVCSRAIVLSGSHDEEMESQFYHYMLVCMSHDNRNRKVFSTILYTQIMAAIALISPPLCRYSTFYDARLSGAAKITTSSRKFGTTFATGSPLCKNSLLVYQRSSAASNSKSVSIRCEQNTKEGNGLDVWLGRLAMVGFASALSVEIATGKGLLEKNRILRSYATERKNQALSCSGLKITIPKARLAQLVERKALNLVVVGSSPTNFGLTSPLPTVALAVTALVGVLTAVFIFQSASKN